RALGPIKLELPGPPLVSEEFFSAVIGFVRKTAAVIFFVLLPRGVFPRIRIDMLLRIGWYKLIAMAFVNIFVALGLVYAGVVGPGGIF
ncbi:MAG: NADH-quinone oxidoreductase subunit H, partial [Thaumarchaeota archaeon]|nr:NADH-quinone oxidoreductase subunit H [Nitrososphaerota archaeon]